MRRDNMAVVSAINNGKTRDDFLGVGMRYDHHHMAIKGAQLSLSYVSTKMNIWADKLSRGCQSTVDELLSCGYRQVFIPEPRLSELMKTDI